MKYVTIASTFSGNKGAASMLEASIQTITKKDSAAEFSVFTIYPEADQEYNTYNNVILMSAKPLFLGLILNPLSLLYRLCPPLRHLLRRQKHVKAIAEADVFLDQGGITFVDGREKFLIYNLATILPAIFIGTPVIKCSQAMGPFSGINKMVAKSILPFVSVICARGNKTQEYLQMLKLNNVVPATDYAFLMDISNKSEKNAQRILGKLKLSKKLPTVVMMPSEVIRKKAESKGQDYIMYNQQFIRHLLNNDYQVLLLAYSARAHSDKRHNNDLPVCRKIAQGVLSDNLYFLDDEIPAQELRYIIGESHVAVTSRFHAMIASLAMGVPPLVIGWSHKYAEIMEMFDMADTALSSDQLDQKKLQSAFDSFIGNHKKYKKFIKENLPKVRKSAEKQVIAICEN